MKTPSNTRIACICTLTLLVSGCLGQSTNSVEIPTDGSPAGGGEATSDASVIEEGDSLTLIESVQDRELVERMPPTRSSTERAKREAVARQAMERQIASQPAIALQSVNQAAFSRVHQTRVVPDHGISRPADLLLPPSATGEQYADLTRNAVIRTEQQSVSTFSIDVDTGAYANVRRFLNNGQLPPAEAVREEELLNYFSYDYAQPDDPNLPFSLVTELGRTPWNAHTRLLHVGLQGQIPVTAETQPANLVFLIDVSGSMNSPDKLGLLKSSISLLASELDARDTVSIVVYAGSSGVVLEPTAGDQHDRIHQALARLSAGGSTHGSEGIQLAYQLASEQYRENGINRVILATDGDFNVGIRDVDALKSLIARKRDSGIALTTLGFGSGNYNDHLMEQLADVGNGNHAYIDTLAEARKVLVDERHATLLTIARDVKIQIEFNPAVVSEYRLIGYNNRVMANEDFNNDRVDAGEVGAGHSVTALYEVALVGDGGEVHFPRRYPSGRTTKISQGEDSQPSGRGPTPDKADEIAEIRLRYKLPQETNSRLHTQIAMLPMSDSQPLDDSNRPSPTSENFRFSASVAGFAQLLRGDERLQDFDFDDVRELATTARGLDPYGYRAEFLRLVNLADSLDRLSRMDHPDRDHDEG